MCKINTPILTLLNLVLALAVIAGLWSPMIFVYAALSGVPIMFCILFNIAFMPIFRGTEPPRVGRY